MKERTQVILIRAGVVLFCIGFWVAIGILIF